MRPGLVNLQEFEEIEVLQAFHMLRVQLNGQFIEIDFGHPQGPLGHSATESNLFQTASLVIIT